jgi:hypothetical protein
MCSVLWVWAAKASTCAGDGLFSVMVELWELRTRARSLSGRCGIVGCLLCGSGALDRQCSGALNSTLRQMSHRWSSKVDRLSGDFDKKQVKFVPENRAKASSIAGDRGRKRLVEGTLIHLVEWKQ